MQVCGAGTFNHWPNLRQGLGSCAALLGPSNACLRYTAADALVLAATDCQMHACSARGANSQIPACPRHLWPAGIPRGQPVGNQLLRLQGAFAGSEERSEPVVAARRGQRAVGKHVAAALPLAEVAAGAGAAGSGAEHHRAIQVGVGKDDALQALPAGGGCRRARCRHGGHARLEAGKHRCIRHSGRLGNCPGRSSGAGVRSGCASILSTGGGLSCCGCSGNVATVSRCICRRDCSRAGTGCACNGRREGLGLCIGHGCG